MKKPIIGITSAYEIEDGLRNYHRTTVSIDYSKFIIESGGPTYKTRSLGSF